MMLTSIFLTLTALSLISAQATTPSLSGPPINLTSNSKTTYPRAATLSNGTILAAYTAFIDTTSQLTLVSSPDSGNTWSFVGTAATRDNPSSDLDNPYPHQLPSGTLVLAYRNHDVDPETEKATTFRITLSFSEDNGATWRFLSEPESYPACPDYSCGVWEPFLRTANDGSLQLYYSKETAADDQDNLVRTSTDDGVTWSSPTIVSGTNIVARDGMVGVARIDEGESNLIAVFESGQNGNFTLNSVTSPDDGVTWPQETRRHVYTATGTNKNAGAPQVVNVGGTLVVSFMTNEDTTGFVWVQGSNAKLLTGGDGGDTWGNKLEVFGVQANWPGMLVLDDGSLLYLADNDGVKAQKVLLS